jgi:hypothetical protein
MVTIKTQQSLGITSMIHAMGHVSISAGGRPPADAAPEASQKAALLDAFSASCGFGRIPVAINPPIANEYVKAAADSAKNILSILSLLKLDDRK